MGRRALVTGGIGALGTAVTRRLLEDGHRVAVTLPARHSGATFCTATVRTDRQLRALGRGVRQR
jgi:nucleoside-diphosphate-sugar epimerase